nr:NAD-dependent epimerase/dehydratase family protein [Melaminivora sp.]
MKIPVMGATDAIGRALIAALAQRGVRVVPPAGGGLQADFSDPPSRQWWVRQLANVDVVVNAAGIIRERGANRFEAVHTDGPIELFHGCAMAGVKHVVQLSALGADAQAATPFHCSKKVADDALRTLGLPATIVQPSLVHGPGIESAGLFDRLALLPWVALPEGGVSQVQPVALQDVIDGLVALALGPPEGTRTLAFVGPQPLALRQHLLVLRRRLGVRTPQRVLPVPAALALAGARVFERLPDSPFTADACGHAAARQHCARGALRPAARAHAALARRSGRRRQHRSALASPGRSAGPVADAAARSGGPAVGLDRPDVPGPVPGGGQPGAAGQRGRDRHAGVVVALRCRRARPGAGAGGGRHAGPHTALGLGRPARDHGRLHADPERKRAPVVAAPLRPLSKNLPLAALIGLLWADRFWQPNTKDP